MKCGFDRNLTEFCQNSVKSDSFGRAPRGESDSLGRGLQRGESGSPVQPQDDDTSTFVDTSRAKQAYLRKRMLQVEQSIGPEMTALLKSLNAWDEVQNLMGVVQMDEGVCCDDLLPCEEWQDVTIQVTLDSGCCDHVVDAGEAPGYCILESAGSKRRQNFVVGNGSKVPNQGEVHLNLDAKVGEG